MEPTIIEAPHDLPIIQEETFAPILYVIRFENLEQAIKMHNNVPQGLSSAQSETVSNINFVAQSIGARTRKPAAAGRQDGPGSLLR